MNQSFSQRKADVCTFLTTCKLFRFFFDFHFRDLIFMTDAMTSNTTDMWSTVRQVWHRGLKYKVKVLFKKYAMIYDADRIERRLCLFIRSAQHSIARKGNNSYLREASVICFLIKTYFFYGTCTRQWLETQHLLEQSIVKKILQPYLDRKYCLSPLSHLSSNNQELKRGLICINLSLSLFLKEKKRIRNLHAVALFAAMHHKRRGGAVP